MKRQFVPGMRVLSFLPAVAVWAVGCANSDSDLISPGPPPTTAAAKLVRPFGDMQTGVVGKRLVRPIGVTVLAENGVPVPGVSVEFTVVQGNGTPEPSVTTTDVNGVASSSWVLGTVSGNNHRMRVVAVGTGLDTIQISATGTADFAVLLTLLAGDGQTGQRGQTLPALIRVKVTDRFGNGVPNQLVKFSPNTRHGSMTPRDMPADAEGLARARWTLGTFAGLQQAGIWSPGLTGSPARISATAQ